MLNVALVGLLAGTLAVGGGDSKNPQAADKPAADTAVPGIFTPSAGAALSPVETPRTVQDTYAFGIADRNFPVRLWADYARGDAKDTYNSGGDTQALQIGFTDGKIVSQRAMFGAELGLPVGLFGFGLSVGGQLTLTKNEFQVSETQIPGNQPPRIGPFPLPAGGLIADDLESSFGLQKAKVYGAAQAGAIGIHGGYIFDLGSERTFAAGPGPFARILIPTSLSNSDGRNAAFFGADFDYPARGFRLFGGVDYYKIEALPASAASATAPAQVEVRGDDIANALFGAGVRLSILELGAALQIQARFNGPTVGDIGTTRAIGGHAVTVSPYLRLSPPQLPGSIFAKGAVQNEDTEFGAALAGANSVRSNLGFTVGLTLGFQ